ncbi:hypothetical protein ABPG74_020229 [Tetrahymena malaccensis]
MNIQFQCDSSQNNKLNVENTRQDEKQNDQPIFQRTQLSNLENYFIQQDKQEFYPRIFVRLKQININVRFQRIVRDRNNQEFYKKLDSQQNKQSSDYKIMKYFQDNKQYNECIEGYKKQKDKLNQLILLNVMSQLKEEDKNGNEVFQRQLDEDLKKFQGKLKSSLDSERSKDIQKRDLISFLYFKVTFYFSHEKFEENYLPSSENLKSLLEFLINLKKQLNYKVQQKIKETKDQLEREANLEIDYESYTQQDFILYFKGLKKHTYSDFFNKIQMEDFEQFQLSKSVLKDEEQFLLDLIECYKIYGNMKMIEQYRSRKSLLYFQFLDNFYEVESPTNLIKDYNVPCLKYFDKYDLFQILLNSDYIEQLEEDEIYLYFLMITLLNLIKFNYISINKEQKLQKLILKIQKLNNPKFKLGYIFLLKLMIDLQQKSCLSDDNQQIQQNINGKENDELINKSTVYLFKEWTKEKYPVSVEYFNQQQLQLYIDGFQSVLILSILPEIVKFYDLNEPLPYQPTGLDLGYIQQIIRGKRLYLKNQNLTDENIKYWQQLIQNMMEMKKQRDYKKDAMRLDKLNKKNNTKDQLPEYAQYGEQNLRELERSFYFKVCQINLETLMNKVHKNNNEQKQRTELLQLFLQVLDVSQYYDIKRKKQIYYTLSSLFIDERDIFEEIIKLFKTTKIPSQEVYQSRFFINLILSLKQEFNINTFINNNKQRTSSTQNDDQLFLFLHLDFMKALKNFEDYFLNFEKQFEKQKLIETKEQFQEIIKFYGFLNRTKYSAFKLNLQIYITQIDLVLELKEALTKKEQKKKIILKDPLEIGKSQFSIYKGKSEQYGDVFVVMKECKNQDDQNKHLLQQIREISILSKLPQNDCIIQYKHHQVNDRSFQLFLEYFDGETLEAYLIKSVENKEEINNNENLKIERLNICIEILKAANHLHQLNIVHGDLKLANILIKINNKQIRVKIIDFSESGFLVEKTIGSTKGYEEKSDFNGIYQDYISIGVLLIRLLYFHGFKYLCNCQDIKECKQSKLHKKQIKMIYKKQFEETKNNYKFILFRQIMTLFNDQPYLRCSLTELIDLMQFQISIFQIQDESQIKGLFSKYFQKYGEIKFKSDDILSSERNGLTKIDYIQIPVEESVLSEMSQTSKNNTNQQNNEEEKINQESHSQDPKPIQTQLEYSISQKQDQSSENTEHKKDQSKLKRNQNLHDKNFENRINQNTVLDSEGFCPKMNIKFQCEYSENNKLNVENTRKYEKQNDQPIFQRTQLSNLENYFIQQDKQEFYPRIFLRLKQININVRKLHSQLKNFNHQRSIEKIFLIVKLIGANNRHLFVSDFLKIAKGIDLFYNLIKKNPIKSEIKKKIMNYYLSYEN